MSREAGALFSRGLHSADDERARIDTEALESSLSFLLAFARDVDARGLPAASGASVEAELR
jgi:hypothetical protein